MGNLLKKFHLLVCLSGVFALQAADASTIGELVLESRVGEPLRAYVEVSPGTGETLTAACVSLSKIGMRPEEESQYLSDANLALEEIGGIKKFRISTTTPLDSPSMKLLLQARCGAHGLTVREFFLRPGFAQNAVLAKAQLPASAELPVATAVVAGNNDGNADRDKDGVGNKTGAKIKLDTIRAEQGVFADKSASSSDSLLHGAFSVKEQSGVWEFVLGARFDVYGQSGTPGFSRAQLDYTENYVRWRGEHTRITVGAQNVLWGRVDEISPVDRMSRVDLSRIILDNLPERRRAVPALRVEHFAGGSKIDAVWLPVFDAAVLPHENSVWNPVDTVNGRLLGIGSVPGIIGAQVREGEHGSGGGGVRFTHSGGKFDYGVSLQRVRQSQPYYRVEPGLLTGVHPFSWVAGGELETQAGGATWRMEAAWSSDVPITTGAFQFRTERAFDAVLGTEFFPGDGDTRATLQLAGHKTFTKIPILDRGEFYNFNGEIEHPFALGRWRANLRFAAGLDERDFYFNPKISYLGIDQHEFFLTAHLFSGVPQALGGYYGQDDLLQLGWLAKF